MIVPVVVVSWLACRDRPCGRRSWSRSWLAVVIPVVVVPVVVVLALLVVIVVLRFLATLMLVVAALVGLGLLAFLTWVAESLYRLEEGW